MFSKNEYIIYGSTGVCKIIDIVKKKFGFNKEREYYILKPAYDTNSTWSYVNILDTKSQTFLCCTSS